MTLGNLRTQAVLCPDRFPLSGAASSAKTQIRLPRWVYRGRGGGRLESETAEFVRLRPDIARPYQRSSGMADRTGEDRSRLNRATTLPT